MDGYEPLDLYYFRTANRDLLRAVGFNLDGQASACSLCPQDRSCRNRQDCDVGFDQIWVPTHVAAILKMNQPGVTNANDPN